MNFCAGLQRGAEHRGEQVHPARLQHPGRQRRGPGGAGPEGDLSQLQLQRHRLPPILYLL